MQLTVIGAGAIGLLYAARLAMSGCSVHVITRTQQQADALSKYGILYQAGVEEIAVPVSASCIDQPALHSLEVEWALLTVKQPALSHSFLKSIARRIGSDTGLVCLQNGIGHLETIRKVLPGTVVLTAVTTEGARRMDAATVRMTGEGELYIGDMGERGKGPNVDDNEHLDSPEKQAKDTLRQEKLLRALRRAGIRASLSNDMSNRVYQKLLLNAVINPLTAIYGIENGQLPMDDHRYSLMRRLHEEAERVLIQAGMDAQPGSWDRLLGVCSKTAANVSSMLADVRGGRLTEVDWINGGIVSLASQYGMEAPLNEAVRMMVHALAPLNE